MILSLHHYTQYMFTHVTYSLISVCIFEMRVLFFKKKNLNVLKR